VTIINTEIEHEDAISASQRPTISALIATSSISHPKLMPEPLARTLKSIKDHVDEVVLIAAGPHPLDFEDLDGHLVVDLNAKDFPHLYVAEQISRSLPTLAGESFDPPQALLVASASSTRELGQTACSCDYILHLQEGEILLSPEYLRGACRLLARYRRRGSYSHHAISTGSRCLPYRASLEILLTTRLPRPEWSGPVRERPIGINTTLIEGSRSLKVRLVGASPKTEHQILYRHCQISDWKVPEIMLMHLVSASRSCGDYEFLMSCVDTVLARSADPETRAWASAMKGDLLISSLTPSPDRAIEWYERSLVEFLTWKTALRLCHAQFDAKRWRECQEAYELANRLREQGTCLLDDSPLDLNPSLLLSTAALCEMGQRTLAKENVQRLLEIFPNNDKVRSLCQFIG